MLKIFKYIGFFFLLPFWFIQKIIPRNKNKWIFGAWSGMKFSDNPKALFDYIISNKSEEINATWITKDKTLYKKLLSNSVPCEYAYSFKGCMTCLVAGVVVVGSGKKDVNEMFINGALIVNTWHGAPMKKIGLDYIKMNDIKRKIVSFFFPFLWDFNIDYIVSTHKVFNNHISSAFDVSLSNILLTGYPRNDLLLRPNKIEYIDKLILNFKSPKIIFYLPTFRDSCLNKDLFFQYDFDPIKWNTYLSKSNTLLLIKGHYAGELNKNNFSEDRIIFIDDKSIPDINEAFGYIDVLITDYSGVYFDFLLTGKRIILAPFDIEDYIAYDRELYFDYYNDFDELAYDNWPQILDELAKSTDNINIVNDYSKRKYNKFYDDKNSDRLFKEIVKIINC